MTFISITIVRSIGWTYNTTTSTTYLLFFKITLEGGVLIWEIKSPKVFRFQFQLEKNWKFSGTKFRGGRKFSDFRFQKFWFLYILFQMVYPIIKHSWGGWTASTWPPKSGFVWNMGGVGTRKSVRPILGVPGLSNGTGSKPVRATGYGKSGRIWMLTILQFRH